MILEKVTKEEKNIVEMEITVPADEFEKAVEAAYKKNVGKMTIPGFRKGKAPRKMIEKMYGSDVFYDDAINAVFPQAYEDAIKEAGITPVDRPDAEPISNDENGFKIKVKVTVKPEVSVKEYKGLKVEKPAVAVTAEDIENELRGYQKRQARMIDVADDDVTKEGDKVVFDFEGFVDGVAFEGGKAEKYNLTLGSGQFIPGFEDQMIGKKAGDEFSVNVTFPEEYHAEDLKGKAAEFKCKLHDIKREELPEIDDELAKDVSDFDTLDELKADIEKKVGERKQAAAESTVSNKIYDMVAELCEADIPECMFENEVDSSMQQFANRMASQGINMQQYMQITGQTVETMRAAFRVNAERDVKIRLALEKIAEIEGIIIDQADIDAEYAKFAEEMKVDVEQLVSDYATENIAKDLSLQKAFDLVKANAEVTEEVADEKKETKAKKTRKSTKKAEEATEEKAEDAE